ncbi:O-antigen ligase [Candidatus Sodalis sp. SoCistrobi]|uniref:O-antigen ligase family protein n=1 Tax=Candidatus Sodalis sp. SoCistrobi TaxID=1922216 RepID=UPI00093C7804|nr:O-antigen ligase family protein [Candidatus Sodalis sp. SoCistrobi]
MSDLSMSEKHKESMKKYIAKLFFCSFFVILPLAFIDEKASRISFYFCGYLGLLGIATNFRESLSSLSICKMILPLLLLSLLYSTWSLLCELVSHNAQGTLFTPGKRWFVAAVISWYAVWLYNQDRIQSAFIRRCCILSISVTFIIASIYGIWQYIETSDRIVFAVDRATGAAYQYSALSLVLIAVVICDKLSLKKKYVIFSSGLLSIYVVFLTETRSVMFIHTLAVIMLILHVIFKDRKINSTPLLFIILTFASVIYSNWNVISLRYNQTKQEVSLYQHGNDNTSLGARFTMWRVGVMTFINAPLGETQYSRNKKIRNFLHSERNQNSDALKYLDVHLHNEIIQTASLFGIFGISILCFFYYTLIFSNGLCKRFPYNPISILSLSAMLYGLTDVILTSIEYVVVFSVLLLTSWLACYNKASNAIEN